MCIEMWVEMHGSCCPQTFGYGISLKSHSLCGMTFIMNWWGIKHWKVEKSVWGRKFRKEGARTKGYLINPTATCALYLFHITIFRVRVIFCFPLALMQCFIFSTRINKVPSYLNRVCCGVFWCLHYRDESMFWKSKEPSKSMSCLKAILYSVLKSLAYEQETLLLVFLF